ncbi:MAG: site-specific integrase [Candidatus Brevundimonas colombiensis]|uniref:Site-specific integrase n=1 Tax=Candidatus Brevundimonas colombiensis TaxID=3121376 RepID=A0AAJ5WWL8_9CAUL|nr:site-specific integrase [Brevundimonas sp.]WEK39596.1 MAG: site-specific integrase [Brevundimonas sp.]
MPDDVRDSAFFGGKSHYQVSLRTNDLNEAKGRALPLGIRFDAEVANLRAGSIKAPILASSEQRILTEEALESIQGKWWSSTIRRDREKRSMADVDPGGEWADRMASDDDHLHFDVARLMDPAKGREALLQMKAHLKVEWADFIAVDARRWGASPGSSDYRRIEEAIVDAQIDALKSIHLAWLGQEAEPTSQRVQRGLSRNLKPQSSWTLKQLALHVLEVQPKGDSWRHKVIEQVVPLFVSHLGEPRPISGISSSDVRSFLEAMSQCPTNATQRFPKRSLAEAIQLNRARLKPYPTVSANTIRDTHFAVLRALFGYAVSQEWLAASPAERIKVAGATKKGGSRPSFKMDELQALFAMPVFTGCKSDAQFGTPGGVLLDDHRYWTPLLMLFTGARPSELGQLAVADIKLSGSTPYISILTEYDPDDPEDRSFYLTCKTPNARREVPLHPALMELGFDRYVRKMQKGGHARLFPQWKAPSDPRKLYSGASWIRRFNEKIIRACTQRHPRPTFYSLRHTFKVAMVRQGIHSAIQNQILGHANAGMDAYYFDAVPLDELYEQVARITYKNLDLGHLGRLQDG